MFSDLPQEFVKELSILQRMQSNLYTGKEGTSDGHRPTQHTTYKDDSKKNKQLREDVAKLPKGQRIWTTFAPPNHRHIYPVFQTIIIDSYKANPHLPDQYNEMSGESIENHVTNYSTRHNTSVFCYLMNIAHENGTTFKL